MMLSLLLGDVWDTGWSGLGAADTKMQTKLAAKYSNVSATCHRVPGDGTSLWALVIPAIFRPLGMDLRTRSSWQGTDKRQHAGLCWVPDE